MPSAISTRIGTNLRNRFIKEPISNDAYTGLFRGTLQPDKHEGRHAPALANKNLSLRGRALLLPIGEKAGANATASQRSPHPPSAPSPASRRGKTVARPTSRCRSLHRRPGARYYGGVTAVFSLAQRMSQRR